MEEEKPIGYIAVIDGEPIYTGSHGPKKSMKLYSKVGSARSAIRRSAVGSLTHKGEVYAVYLSKCEEV